MFFNLNQDIRKYESENLKKNIYNTLDQLEESKKEQ